MGNLSTQNNITSIRFYRYGAQGISLLNGGSPLNNLDNYTFNLYDKSNNIVEDEDLKCESNKGNILIKYFNPNPTQNTQPNYGGNDPGGYIPPGEEINNSYIKEGTGNFSPVLVVIHKGEEVTINSKKTISKWSGPVGASYIFVSRNTRSCVIRGGSSGSSYVLADSTLATSVKTIIDTIKLNKYSEKISSSINTITLTLSANISWLIADYPDWVDSITPTSGESSGYRPNANGNGGTTDLEKFTININVKEYTGINGLRKGYIIFRPSKNYKYYNGGDVIFTIIQKMEESYTANQFYMSIVNNIPQKFSALNYNKGTTIQLKLNSPTKWYLSYKKYDGKYPYMEATPSYGEPGENIPITLKIYKNSIKTNTLSLNNLSNEISNINIRNSVNYLSSELTWFMFEKLIDFSFLGVLGGMNLTCDKTEFDCIVNSYIDWELLNIPSFIEVSQTSGTKGITIVHFSYPKIEKDSSKNVIEYIITCHGTDSELYTNDSKITLRISQTYFEDKEYYIYTDYGSILIDNTSENITKTIQIYSNTDWRIYMDIPTWDAGAWRTSGASDWPDCRIKSENLTLFSQVEGNGNGEVTITMNRNESHLYYVHIDINGYYNSNDGLFYNYTRADVSPYNFTPSYRNLIILASIPWFYGESAPVICDNGARRKYNFFNEKYYINNNYLLYNENPLNLDYTSTVSFNENSIIELNKYYVTIDKKSQSINLNIISDTDWIIDIPSWCSVSKFNGGGNDTITITIEENNSNEIRCDVINVRSSIVYNFIHQTLHITQTNTDMTPTIPNYTISINSITPNLDNVNIQYKINNGNYTSIQVGEAFTVTETDTWKVEAEAPVVAGGPNYYPYSISGTGNSKPNIDIVLSEADVHTIEITEANTLNGALKFYNGNTVTSLEIPYFSYYYDGFAIRLMAAATGYAHQMIIDSEGISDDISTSIDLTPISTNDLFVSVLNNSTQHTNHYISVQESGTSITVYPRVYYLQSQYRTVNVDLIIDHDGDFDINLPENGRYHVESTINPNTIIYDVYFSLSEEDTEAEFTISNSVKTYTINLYF